MPSVSFTANLQRHVAAPPREVVGSTVREALDAVFAQQPTLRSYILDDTAALRKHIAVFVDGIPVRDRNALSDPVAADADICVMQALSGG